MTGSPGDTVGGAARVWGEGVTTQGYQSLYSQSESLVRVLGSKSVLFPKVVGLRQGCALTPILFVIFMDQTRY